MTERIVIVNNCTIHITMTACGKAQLKCQKRWVFMWFGNWVENYCIPGNVAFNRSSWACLLSYDQQTNTQFLSFRVSIACQMVLCVSFGKTKYPVVMRGQWICRNLKACISIKFDMFVNFVDDDKVNIIFEHNSWKMVLVQKTNSFGNSPFACTELPRWNRFSECSIEHSGRFLQKSYAIMTCGAINFPKWG